MSGFENQQGEVLGAMGEPERAFSDIEVEGPLRDAAAVGESAHRGALAVLDPVEVAEIQIGDT
jgi:phosphoribosylformylglycinamidine (FGAM) synthase-like amidotransferase family enzyme